MFLYEADGGTQHRRSERKREQVTSNQHFFSELSQRILKRAAERGPYGRLYGMETPAPFTTQGAPLTKSIIGLENYFQSEDVALETRMRLCRTRVVLGNELMHNQVMNIIHHIVYTSRAGIQQIPISYWRGEFSFKSKLRRTISIMGAVEL